MNESLIKKQPVARKIAKKKYNKPNIIYNRLSFYNYSDDKKFDRLSKYSYLLNVYDDLQKLIKMKPINLGKIKEKEKVHNIVSELYNKRFENYYYDCNELSDVKKDELEQKFKPINLKLKDYDYDEWFVEKELDDEEELDYMSQLEGDEEVREGKGLKFLTPNKLLTRLPILLTQIKAGNNSYKLEHEIRQILYLLHRHDKITKKVYNNLIKSL